MTHYAFGLPGCRRSGSNGWLFVTFGARSRWRLYAFAENIKGVRLCICALVSTLGDNGLEGTITAAYSYTADGLRSRWDPVNAFTWHYLYDPSGNLAVRQWITQGGTTANYGADDVSIYEGYGVLRQCAAPKSLGWSAIAAFDSIGFGGQYGYQTDLDTGLVFCTHRYYDPSTGRWLTRDPIGYAGGVNEYAYCGGNPVNGADPSGTSWYEMHHLFPKFLGGSNEVYNFIRLDTPQHKELTRDMAKFLKGIVNEVGQDMQPRRGNRGDIIQWNFPRREDRLNALRQFYSQYKEKYPEAAKQFLQKWGALEKSGGEAALEEGKALAEQGEAIWQEFGYETEPLAQWVVEKGAP